MSKIKLTANLPQFPRILPNLNLAAFKSPHFSFSINSIKDNFLGIIAIVLCSSAILMLLAGYGLYASKENAHTLYEKRILSIKNINTVNDLIQSSDLAVKAAAGVSNKTKNANAASVLPLIEKNNLTIKDLSNKVGATLKANDEKVMLDSFTESYDHWYSKTLKPAAIAASAGNYVLASQLASSEEKVNLLDQSTKALIALEYEAAKSEAIFGQAYFYFFFAFGLLLVACSAITVSYLLFVSKRLLDSQLGAEPEELVRAAGYIASGDLHAVIKTRKGDHSSALAAIKAIQEELKLFMYDTEILNKGMSQGKMLGRRNLDQHQGDYQKIADELNTSIDLALTHGQDSDKKRKEIQRVLESTKSEVSKLKEAFAQRDLSQRLEVKLDCEHSSIIASTINQLVDDIELAISELRDQTLALAPVSAGIHEQHIEFETALENQNKVISQSQAKLEVLNTFHKKNSKKAKNVQSLSLKATQALQDICYSLDTLESLDAAKKAKKVKNPLPEINQAAAPLEGYDYVSFISSFKDVTISDEEARTVSHSIEELKTKLADTIRLINSISEDSSALLTNSMQQNIEVASVNTALTQAESARQQYSHLLQQSLKSYDTLDGHIEGLNTQIQDFFLSSDKEKLLIAEKEAQALAEAQEHIFAEQAVAESPVAKEPDWELF
jgi:methyl-accepting chemotaxis protein